MVTNRSKQEMLEEILAKYWFLTFYQEVELSDGDSFTTSQLSEDFVLWLENVIIGGYESSDPEYGIARFLVSNRRRDALKMLSLRQLRVLDMYILEPHIEMRSCWFCDGHFDWLEQDGWSLEYFQELDHNGKLEDCIAHQDCYDRATGRYDD